jgi:hypothetical protein
MDFNILSDHAAVELRVLAENQGYAMDIALHLTVEVDLSLDVTLPVIVRSSPIVEDGGLFNFGLFKFEPSRSGLSVNIAYYLVPKLAADRSVRLGDEQPA